MTKHKNVQRRFFLGDDWLYYKIYGGPAILEKVLLNQIHGVIRDLLEANYIEKFFFVRYQDPQYHLRLRFYIPDRTALVPVISALNGALATFIEQRFLSSVQTDTYNREIERYGSDVITQIETLFHHSSLHILDHLRLREENGSLPSWYWGMQYADKLLNSFGFSLEGKMKFVKSLSENFSAEVGFDKNMKLALDNKYRMETSRIHSCLNEESLQNKHTFHFPIDEIAVIIISLDREKDPRIATGVIASIIHMHFNRLFRSKQRSYEFVIYYLLKKYYSSLTAKIKYNVTIPSS